MKQRTNRRTGRQAQAAEAPNLRAQQLRPPSPSRASRRLHHASCGRAKCGEVHFLKTLKAEAVDHADYATHAEARRDVFVFLEAWYNRQRLHSAIGYITPEQMELTAA